MSFFATFGSNIFRFGSNIFHPADARRARGPQEAPKRVRGRNFWEFMKTTKPLFLPHQNADLGFGCPGGEMPTRWPRRPKRFEIVDVLYEIRQSGRCRIALH